VFEGGVVAEYGYLLDNAPPKGDWPHGQRRGSEEILAAAKASVHMYKASATK
jgi:hypothetical protein